MKKLSHLLGTVLLLLSASTVTLAAPFLFELPDPDAGGSRYAFTWSGEIQGITDPLYTKFNDQKFTLSGFYFSKGTFDFTRIEVFLPPPEIGGPGSLVALPDPLGYGTGCLALPSPAGGGGGGIISLIPQIEITLVPNAPRQPVSFPLTSMALPPISPYQTICTRPHQSRNHRPSSSLQPASPV